MKNIIKLPIILPSLFFFFSLISCASLKDTKLKNNPDFEKNAEKYLVASPLILPSSEPYRIVFEDTLTNAVYEIMLEWSEESNIEGYIDEQNMEKGDVGIEREFVGQRVIISNPVDDKKYEVIGKSTISRSLYKSSDKSTVETTVISYPIEFWIFEQGNDVGKITMPEASMYMSVFIHDRQMNLEFQGVFVTERSFSFEYQNDLIAFFELKPDKFFVENLEGKALLKPGLSNDIKADIFTSYIVADIIVNILRQK